MVSAGITCDLDEDARIEWLKDVIDRGGFLRPGHR